MSTNSLDTVPSEVQCSRCLATYTNLCSHCLELKPEPTFWQKLKLKMFKTEEPKDLRPITYIYAVLPVNTTSIQIMIDLLPLFKLSELLLDQLNVIKESDRLVESMLVTIKVEEKDKTIEDKIQRMLNLMNYERLFSSPTEHDDSIEILEIWKYKGQLNK